MELNTLIEPFARIQTGVSGLDLLLGGGLLEGGTYLLLGPPGSGKTILANQICFHRESEGAKALYVTLLAENHTRMFGNLSSLRFFKQDQVGLNIQYISGYTVLREEGLPGLMRSLEHLVRQHQATFLVIDGLSTADSEGEALVQFKEFVHNLNAVLGLFGCTTLLLSAHVDKKPRPEYTMVDGILTLSTSEEGLRTTRKIEVQKFRGGGHLHGHHYYQIIENGIVIYPRVEEAFTPPEKIQSDISRMLSFGIPTLDALVSGGVNQGSVTAILGAAGLGKTVLGVNFLVAGAQIGEKGLHFSFYEHPDQLWPKLTKLGVDVEPQIQSGMLSSSWHLSAESYIDKLVHELLECVDRRQIRRVFLDGADGLQASSTDNHRLQTALTVLFNQLKARGVTTLLTEERDLFLAEKHLLSNFSGLCDNILYLRHVELDSVRSKSIQVIKTRETAHDPVIYEWIVSEDGTGVGEALEDVKALLPIVRRKSSPNNSRRRWRLKRP